MRVGIAQLDFTPAAGLPLMGNFRSDYAARDVHDPLMAKAMVFEDAGGAKAAMLALDVCMLDRDNVALIGGAIERETGIPRENVLVHATHTHSAPAPCDRYLAGVDFEPHRPAVEAFLTKAAGAVVAADERLAPASLSVGHASEEGISFNRRLRRRDGSTQMNWEALAPGFDPDQIEGPWGPIDPEVVCLVVEREGRPAAAVVNFGLHPAILAGDNWLYSADFPGYLAEAMRQAMGGDFVCLFFNGCCGNVNHVDYRDLHQGRGFAMAQHVGSVLAAAAHRAIGARAPTSADGVAVARDDVVLERIKIPADEQARCRQVLEEARDRPPQGQVDGLPEAFFAEVRLAMAAVQDTPDRTQVAALRVGDVALVGLPGENFCESGLAIKRRSPAKHTLVAGLCGDAIGYLPTRESFDQGGYETTTGSTLYEPGAAQRLVDAAVEQLHRLFEK